MLPIAWAEVGSWYPNVLTWLCSISHLELLTCRMHPIWQSGCPEGAGLFGVGASTSGSDTQQASVANAQIVSRQARQARCKPCKQAYRRCVACQEAQTHIHSRVSLLVLTR
jgi:hypothetical protein